MFVLSDFPGLPETKATLAHVLVSDSGRAARINCTAAEVGAMAYVMVKQCWSQFHADLETTRSDYYGRVAPAIRAAFPVKHCHHQAFSWDVSDRSFVFSAGWLSQ